MNNAQKIVRVAGLGLVLTAFSAGAAQAAACGPCHPTWHHTRPSGITCVNGGAVVTKGGAEESGGFLSGNVIQTPINAPINACGNQVDLLGLLDNIGGGMVDGAGGGGGNN